MKWLTIMFLLFGCSLLVTAKVGYFWHISNIHYDANFSPKGDHRRRCWEHRDKHGNAATPLGSYGDYNCDSPWQLVESAVHAMKKRHSDVEFILWTGDGLTHFGGGHLTSSQLQSLQNVTELLHRTFNSQFIFPVLGNEESHDHSRNFRHGNKDYEDLADLWRLWLPTEAIQTFKKGGYYTIEQKGNRLRIIVLNTNLFTAAAGSDEDPAGQWSWLVNTLDKSKSTALGGPWKVYIVGNIPPGVDERQGGHLPFPTNAYLEHFNHKYLQLVRRYSDTIIGQFFGHLHSDTFRVIYNNDGIPVSWAFIAPGVSPKKPGGPPNNPAIRLYKFNTETGVILDYMQYFLDLLKTAQTGTAHWQLEYNFTSYYDVNEISAMTLNDLVERFTKQDSQYMARYYRANSVQLGSDICSDHCQNTHYCSITQVDYYGFQRCMETTASALAKATTSHRPWSTIHLFATCAFTRWLIMPYFSTS